MGTWDEGILDNDTALDGLADLTHTILNQVVEFGSTSGRLGTERLAAGIGLLLQLDAFSVSPDSPDSAKAIQLAVQHHLGRLATWPNQAKKILRQIAEGHGHELAQRHAVLSRSLAQVLHANPIPGAGFGRREPWLFAKPGAAAHVQSISRLCVSAVDDDFEEEDNWSDLCREGIGAGHLAALYW